MKSNELIPLIAKIYTQANWQGITFPSLPRPIDMKGMLLTPYLKSLSEEELWGLAGNLIIDYNDSADFSNPAHEQLWDEYLAPINTLYLTQNI